MKEQETIGQVYEEERKPLFSPLWNRVSQLFTRRQKTQKPSFRRYTSGDNSMLLSGNFLMRNKNIQAEHHGPLADNLADNLNVYKIFSHSEFREIPSSLEACPALEIKGDYFSLKVWFYFWSLSLFYFCVGAFCTGTILTIGYAFNLFVDLGILLTIYVVTSFILGFFLTFLALKKSLRVYGCFTRGPGRRNLIFSLPLA